jgi:hypothetical protein
MGKADTQNPKFGTSNEGQRSGQVSPTEGMNVGGLTDAQVRTNMLSQGVMLMRQLKKNKSGSSPL